MNPSEWIEEWLLLWPAEIKSGGETIRSKAKYCVNKMIKWCKQHPQYDKNAIFAATKAYLAERKAENYFGVRRAMYFIDKQGAGSTLETYCEDMKKHKQYPVTTEQSFSKEYEPIKDFI